MNEAVLVMLMNYLHDLATGLLFGSVASFFLAKSIVGRKLDPDAALAATGALYRKFRPVVLGALAVVLLGGIPRAVFYHEYEWLPSAGRGQVTALVIKHILLVTVTAGSLGLFFLKGRTTPSSDRAGPGPKSGKPEAE